MVQRASVERTRRRHRAHAGHTRPAPAGVAAQVVVPRAARAAHTQRVLRRVHLELRPAGQVLARHQRQAARHQSTRLRLSHSLSQGVRRRRQRGRHQNGRQQSQHGHGAQLPALQVQRPQDDHGEHQKGDAVHQDHDSTSRHRLAFRRAAATRSSRLRRHYIFFLFINRQLYF